MKIFVYGTLKKGYSNHHYLKDSTFVRNDKINYRMFKGHLPYLTKLKGKTDGEIYLINDETLEQLDKLEGHPFFYKREFVQIKEDKVIVYFYTKMPEGVPTTCF